MNVIVPIPDDLAERLSAGQDDLPRRALEAFGLEEFRAGRLTLAELRRLLGFASRVALDGFLKSHGDFEDYTLEDFDQDVRDLEKAGF